MTKSHPGVRQSGPMKGTPRRRTITMRFRPALYEKIKQSAMENQRSLSEEIEWALEIQAMRDRGELP